MQTKDLNPDIIINTAVQLTYELAEDETDTYRLNSYIRIVDSLKYCKQHIKYLEKENKKRGE